MLYQVFLKFIHPHKIDSFFSGERNFFDYSSGEKIKLMRAAGREAQKEKQKILKEYEALFGGV